MTRRSPRPQYVDCAHRFRALLRTDRGYQVGARIAATEAIMNTTGARVNTARHALRLLAEWGELEVTPGVRARVLPAPDPSACQLVESVRECAAQVHAGARHLARAVPEEDPSRCLVDALTRHAEQVQVRARRLANLVAGDGRGPG
jgi:DNA-binding GntR family transcriptional regulator